jgi:DNA mismatch endonuclease (patch repair protein)
MRIVGLTGKPAVSATETRRGIKGKHTAVELPEGLPATVRSKPSTLRLHRGDIMSPEKRSALMGRIRGRDTGPEREFRKLLKRTGRKFESHARDLPGRPDFVFRRTRVAVFVDGDFWHGWRFPAWRLKLSEKWEAKIESNRRRDARNHARLRRAGWLVVRIWEHQMQRNPLRCLEKVLDAIKGAPGASPCGLVGTSPRAARHRGNTASCP